MSHFCVVVCLDDTNETLAAAQPPDALVNERLEAVLAPWDENREMPPYRRYEDGGPEDYWLYQSLRQADENNRNGTGIQPYKPGEFSWSSEFSKQTPDEQRAEIARKAALFRTLPEPVTWEAVLDIGKILYPDDADEKLLIDGDRAYTMSTYNPESKFDYWRIGGRWGGHFTRKADSNGSPFLLPEKSWDSPDRFAFFSCDGGPKRVLDLTACRDKAAEEAVKTYQEYHGLVDHLPEAQPWSAFTVKIDDGSGYTIEQARKDYRTQPRMQAVQGTDFQWGTTRLPSSASTRTSTPSGRGPEQFSASPW